MRRLSALAVAVAAAGSFFTAGSANAVGVSTCVAAAHVYVGPYGVYVQELYVGSVWDCLGGGGTV